MLHVKRSFSFNQFILCAKHTHTFNVNVTNNSQATLLFAACFFSFPILYANACYHQTILNLVFGVEIKWHKHVENRIAIEVNTIDAIVHLIFSMKRISIEIS